MLLFGANVLTSIVLVEGMIPYVSESFAKIIFLSNSLTFMMVYVWSKQNPFIHMSLLGLFTFTAAYLPWAIEKLPVVPGVFKLIGIWFSTWFVYRYLLFKPDRKELVQIINKSLADVIGQ